jgi:hypothetical protein
MTVPGLAASSHQLDLLWALAASLERASDQADSLALGEEADSVDHANELLNVLTTAEGYAADLGIDLHPATTTAHTIQRLCSAADGMGANIDHCALLERVGREIQLVAFLHQHKLEVARRMDMAPWMTERGTRALMRVSLWVTQYMVRLLPRADRPLYAELYRSELAELAQAKRGRRAQIGYTLRALVRVWSLRRALAAEAIGEVDQA